MEEKNSFVDYLRQRAILEGEKSGRELYRGAALFGAATCLEEAKEITDPVEQVKYLHEKFIHSDLKFMAIPWAWLKHCVEKKLITKLPNEDWVNSLFIAGANFEGGPELVLKFLQNSMPQMLI